MEVIRNRQMDQMNENRCVRKNNSKIYKEILDSIDEISYGEVVITVHDKKIVQIEKKEKKRF
jgi:hypothetical protein